MSLTPAQRLAAVRVRLAEFQDWRNREYRDLTEWTWNGMPLPLGAAWPEAVPATLTHGTVEVPSSWDPNETFLELEPGGEALVHVRYEGSEESFGLDPYHRRLPLRDRSFSIEIEAVPRLPFGVPNRAPRLERARLVWAETAVDRFERLVGMVVDAAEALDGAEVAIPLLQAAESALHDLTWPSATVAYLSRTEGSPEMQAIWSLPAGLEAHPPALSDADRASVTAATNALLARLIRLQDLYPPHGAIALSGHAHIDLAWLWPMDETRRKARRTFNTVLSLMDRYPEMRFNQSSAQLYSFMEEDDPALFAAIRERVAGGQWEPVGGMWVEPDTNMPSGESLVRQLLYGQRYFERTFGALHTVCWLPDCFGFTPALPQIMRGAGIENFFTIKVTWSETNRFPYDLFWWEGLDGSRVLTHIFDNPSHQPSETSGYNGDVSPSPLLETWRRYGGKYRHPRTLLSVGYGDGGGGPTAGMLERARDLSAFPALPAVGWDTVRSFYEEMRAAVEGQTLPLWVGELYLELHRGTLTTQGRTKYLHRRVERDLVAAEAIDALAALLDGPRPRSFEAQWQVLLRNEFHDILPGSSIRQVYERAEAELGSVIVAARSGIEAALAGLAERLIEPGDRPALLTVNPDLSPRPLRLHLTDSFPGAQPVEGGSVLTGPEVVPPLGVRVVLDPGSPGPLRISERELENDALRVQVGDDGALLSVWDKRSAREVLAGRGNQIWAYVDKPRNWDAWDIDVGYWENGQEIPARSIEIEERGPHRVSLRVERAFRSSRIVQHIRLWSNSARLEMATEVDWHDRHWLLQAHFPVAVRSGFATFETAFGVVERPTHQNTSWDQARFEVAAHRFVDLSEPGYGAALLNDGKYGHHVWGNVMGISLLRSPAYPDPLADEGHQSFTYALYPHAGGWLEGGVLMEAEDLNLPLPALVTSGGEETVRQPIRLEGPQLALGAFKRAEDSDDLLLRVYEPQGARGTVRLSVEAGWTADAETDLLERVVGPPDLEIRPFGIHTWRLTAS